MQSINRCQQKYVIPHGQTCDKTVNISSSYFSHQTQSGVCRPSVGVIRNIPMTWRVSSVAFPAVVIGHWRRVAAADCTENASCHGLVPLDVNRAWPGGADLSPALATGTEVAPSNGVPLPVTQTVTPFWTSRLLNQMWPNPFERSLMLFVWWCFAQQRPFCFK